MADRKVGQQDIADALGLSRSLVTKVLSHDPMFRVAPETRELVLNKAHEMGYDPRRRTTRNIAFLVCGEVISDVYELFDAIGDEAARLGFRVFLVKKQAMPAYREVSVAINPLSVDGALVYGPMEDEVATRLSNIVPTVFFGERSLMPRADWVWGDDILMAKQLTGHVIGLGHRL